MQVVHLLPPVVTRVGHNPKAPFWVGQGALTEGQLARLDHDFAHHLFVLRGQLGHGGDVGFGDHQKMDRCPRFDVVKGQEVLVFVDFFGRDLSCNDFAKDAVVVMCVMVQDAHRWVQGQKKGMDARGWRLGGF